MIEYRNCFHHADKLPDNDIIEDDAVVILNFED